MNRAINMSSPIEYVSLEPRAMDIANTINPRTIEQAAAQTNSQRFCFERITPISMKTHRSGSAANPIDDPVVPKIHSGPVICHPLGTD